MYGAMSLQSYSTRCTEIAVFCRFAVYISKLLHASPDSTLADLRSSVLSILSEPPYCRTNPVFLNMTDWKSPAVAAADYFALLKLCHVMAGILIWEFVVYIGFEYSFFAGKRQFCSSFLLYLGARWFPMFAIIVILVGFDSANRINCQAYVISIFLFSYLSAISASALIGLRIAAIWGLNKIVVSIAFIAWLVQTGFLIHGVAVLRATWSGGICTITNPSKTRNNILVALVTDLVLLVLMFTGLLRWQNSRQRGSVWWLLYTQGLAWMIIVVVAEALITVFILLNLNDAMNLMFQVPALLTLTICASRMYRGLADYFLHNEANVHIGARLSKPRFLAPRSGQSSVALGISGTLDGHIFVTEHLAPPRHHFGLGENNDVW
ncbi:hypothetical protein EDB89DRAFT_2242500 [Lactarius sanguifluus]|nr:hypothetical protein EDB89DRAFT_2242500 [Lactarius sanguifluus]